jgi:Zn-dependent oligopeptidase
MELWLTERSTLYALIGMSDSSKPLSEDSIDAAFRLRSHEKALQWAQQTFYARLELELFSGFNLRDNTETIPALQTRLARALIPHDVPSPKDLTPLLDILRENIHGRHVAWYRYLWCDALSASFMEQCQAKATVSDDPKQFTRQLRTDMRQWILEPGAAVDVAGFRSQFGLKSCTPEALWKRFDL